METHDFSFLEFEFGVEGMYHIDIASEAQDTHAKVKVEQERDIHGTMVLWHHGTLVPWYHVTLVL